MLGSRALLLLACTGLLHAAAGLPAVLEHLSSKAEAYTQDLKTLVAFQSVSADPSKLPDLLAAADWLLARLTAAGLQVMHDACTLIPKTLNPAPQQHACFFALPILLASGGLPRPSSRPHAPSPTP